MKIATVLHLGSVLFWSGLSLVAAAATAPSHGNVQHPLANHETTSIPKTESPKPGVPGHNDAFYGPVPRDEQIFHIQFLEIAPSPIIVSQYFFILLRGDVPSSTRRRLDLKPEHLAEATVSITASATLKNGDKLGRYTVTTPLRTLELAEGAHISIRNSTGAYVDHLEFEGRNDILTDYWIPGMFLESGNYTFEVVASLGGQKEETCLFTLTLTQWLEGEPGW